MTEKRLVTIAEYLNPVARREHEVQEAGLEIQAARVSLQKSIALAQFQQDSQHHADQMALRQNELMLDARRHADDMEVRKGELFQEERHHADRMNVMAQTNELRGRQLDLSEERSAAEIALGRDRLTFEEKRASLDAEVSYDTAVIQAQTSLAVTAMQQRGAQEVALMGHETTLAVARLQQEGTREVARMGHEVTFAVTQVQQESAREIARMGHEAAIVVAQVQGEQARSLAELQGDQSTALAQLNHKQAMTLAREETHLRTIEIAGKLPYEAIASTLRKSEDTNRALSGGMATIFVERQKARLAAYLEDQQEKHRENAHRRQMEAEGQKEAHRANERGHELTMAERSARFARIGFTRDELIAAGFSAEEAALIVSCLINGLNPQDEIEVATFEKFDRWVSTKS